jgi:putative ABC transport system permease protein
VGNPNIRPQLEYLLHDLRYGLRMVRRTAPLSIAVVLTLVVGLGLNSVVFSLFNGLLFRAPVTRDPATFVQVYGRPSGERQSEFHGPDTLVTLEESNAIRAQSQTLAAVTVSRWVSFTMGDDAGPSLRGKLVSCNYVSAHLGPVRFGRGLIESDCAAPGAQPVVVLSERAWTLHFGGDASIVGREVRLNSHLLTVVGIAPDDAAGDPVAAMFYVPYTMQPALQGPTDYFRDPPARHAWLSLSGRLRPGRSIEEAQAELTVIAASLDRLHPGQVTGMLVTDGAIIHEPNTARTMPLLVGLCLGTTALLLLMVCANVTALLLARAVARRHEMAVRVSLGGSRARLVRQLLTEAVALAGCAGVASVGLAYYLPSRLAQMLTDFPLRDVFGPDWRVLGFTLALAMMAGCLAGISPAIETLRFNLASTMQPAGQGGAAPVSSRLRGLLIGNQLSISLALLIAIALIVRAQKGLLNVAQNDDGAAIMVTAIDLSHSGYTGPSARAFYDRLTPSLLALPGVQAVALASPAPFRGHSRISFTRDGGYGPTLLADSRSVSRDYFSAVGLRVSKGRLFTEVETRAPGRIMPIIVSESFARTFFPASESLGRRIRFGNDDVAEIVGIVDDRSSVRPMEPDEPMLYQPIYTANLASITPVLRFDGEPRPLKQAIRALIATLDANLSPVPETLAETIAKEAGSYAALVRMTAIPAMVALFLAVIGIYGLTAFAAAQRTQEIGVRIALGARPLDVIALFSRSLSRPLIAGILGGSFLAAISITLLKRTNVMITVSVFDPLAYGVGIVMLVCVATAATLIPAIRAARNEPWSTLRGR